MKLINLDNEILYEVFQFNKDVPIDVFSEKERKIVIDQCIELGEKYNYTTSVEMNADYISKPLH